MHVSGRKKRKRACEKNTIQNAIEIYKIILYTLCNAIMRVDLEDYRFKKKTK
jgi:hypothetical protein